MARILLIDDEPDLLELYQISLEDEGHTVATSTEATTAIELATQFRPEIIGLYWVMPGMVGEEVLRKLQATPETRSIPVLVISALHGLEPHARRLGAIGVLTKPFRPRALLDAVARVLPARELSGTPPS
jgi:CheY-like chemotaxis protein